MRLSDNKEKIIKSIEKLNEDTQPSWGKLTPSTLLPHLTDPFQIALKERPLNFRVPGPKWLLKWLVIYSPIPWPKGVKAPEDFLYTKPSTTLAEDKEKLIEYLEKFLVAKDLLIDHPVFGKMSKKDWDTLLSRHLKHHFVQFKCLAGEMS